MSQDQITDWLATQRQAMMDLLRDVGVATYAGLLLWLAGCCVIWSRRRSQVVTAPQPVEELHQQRRGHGRPLPGRMNPLSLYAMPGAGNNSRRRKKGSGTGF